MAMTPEERKVRRDQRTAERRARKQRLVEIQAKLQRQFADFKASMFAKGYYEIGDANVSRQAEGSIVYRTAYGPTKESVDAAHEHFLANHPFNRDHYGKPPPRNPNDTFSGSVQEAKTFGKTKWQKTWTHWNEYL